MSTPNNPNAEYNSSSVGEAIVNFQFVYNINQIYFPILIP